MQMSEIAELGANLFCQKWWAFAEKEDKYLLRRRRNTCRGVRANTLRKETGSALSVKLKSWQRNAAMIKRWFDVGRNFSGTYIGAPDRGSISIVGP